MNIEDRLKAGNLSEQEEDEIFGALIRRFEEDQLKEKWSNLLEEKIGLVRPAPAQPVLQPRLRRRSWWTGLAAALIIGLLFAVWSLWPTTQNGAQLLAAEIDNIQLTTQRDATQPGTDKSLLRQTFNEAYQAEDWEASIQTGKQIMAQDAVSSSDILHLGFAYLQLAQYDNAEELFAQILARNDVFRVEARFYLGVAQLARGDIEKGKNTLEKIGASAGEKYYQKAIELVTSNYK